MAWTVFFMTGFDGLNLTQIHRIVTLLRPRRMGKIIRSGPYSFKPARYAIKYSYSATKPKLKAGVLSYAAMGWN